MKRTDVLIDTNKCIGCGECVRDCITRRFGVENGKAVLLHEGCLDCGHCYAVCPAGAIELPGYDGPMCSSFSPPGEMDAGRLLAAMKSRRSVRYFTDRPVSPAQLEMLLEAGRYSPTACNAQGVHFIVLDSVRAQAEAMAIDFLVKQPFFSRKDAQPGYLFRGAPLVILTAESRSDNAAFASAYMELLAHALGLGALYNGYFVAAANNCPELRELIGTPEGMNIVSCLVIGQPDVRYRRVPPRHEAKLTVR